MFSCFGLGERHPQIPDQYVRPQGLYGSTVEKLDHKRLKRFIQDGRLAPCFPGCDTNEFTDEHKVTRRS